MTAALRDLSKWAEIESKKRPTTSFAERLIRFNWLLLSLALAVSGIGLFNQFVVGQTTPDDFFWGHLLRVCVGFLAFVLVSLVDPRWLRRLAFSGALVALILLRRIQKLQN